MLLEGGSEDVVGAIEDPCRGAEVCLDLLARCKAPSIVARGSLRRGNSSYSLQSVHVPIALPSVVVIAMG